MQAKTYQECALLTKSPVGHLTLERFVQHSREYQFITTKLFDCLAECDFDKLKRTLYYGEAGEPIPSGSEELDFTHGVIGVITELFELLELYREQDHIDPIHLKEELGDLLWYISLIASSQKVDLADVMESNIRKLALRNRNKGRFDLAGTLERNLEDERKELEGDKKEYLSQKQMKQLQGYNSEKLTEDKGCSIK